MYKVMTSLVAALVVATFTFGCSADESSNTNPTSTDVAKTDLTKTTPDDTTKPDTTKTTDCRDETVGCPMGKTCRQSDGVCEAIEVTDPMVTCSDAILAMDGKFRRKGSKLGKGEISCKVENGKCYVNLVGKHLLFNKMTIEVDPDHAESKACLHIDEINEDACIEKKDDGLLYQQRYSADGELLTETSHIYE